MAATTDVQRSYEALRRGAGLLRLSGRRRFSVRGRDRARFLHNMLTNDILALRPGQGCSAHKVSHQGKMEAAMRVLCLEEEIWCDLEGEALEALLAGMKRRIVLEDAVLAEDGGAWALLSVQGPAAAASLARLGCDTEALGEMHRHAPARIEGHEVRVVRSDHTGDGGYDLWVAAPRAAAGVDGSSALQTLETALVAAGAHPVGPAVLEVRRVEAGIPRPGREITNAHFPQEAGLEDGWISYTKGCYLGQEPIARIHHMGHVNRALRGLVFDEAALPEPGDRLRSGDKDVGEVTSAVHSLELDRPIALAYVRREHGAPGAQLLVESSATDRSAAGATPSSAAGTERQARVVPLPFV